MAVIFPFQEVRGTLQVSKLRSDVFLPLVPPTASVGAWAGIRLIDHSSVTSWAVTVFVGLLSVICTFGVSPETNATFRLWIKYRTERQIAAAEVYEIKRRARLATTQTRFTRAAESNAGKDADSFARPNTRLSEVMKISRSEGSLSEAGTISSKKQESTPQSQPAQIREYRQDRNRHSRRSQKPSPTIRKSSGQ
jgi:hypothetical protein